MTTFFSAPGTIAGREKNTANCTLLGNTPNPINIDQVERTFEEVGCIDQPSKLKGC